MRTQRDWRLITETQNAPLSGSVACGAICNHKDTLGRATQTRNKRRSKVKRDEENEMNEKIQQLLADAATIAESEIWTDPTYITGAYSHEHLEATHKIISAMPIDSFERFQLHQALNQRILNRMPRERYGEPVYGLHNHSPYNAVVQTSLFDGITDGVIGVGTTATIRTHIIYDLFSLFNGEDGMGGYAVLVKHDADWYIIRESISGRHSFCARVMGAFSEDNWGFSYDPQTPVWVEICHQPETLQVPELRDVDGFVFDGQTWSENLPAFGAIAWSDVSANLRHTPEPKSHYNQYMDERSIRDLRYEYDEEDDGLVGGELLEKLRRSQDDLGMFSDYKED